jgi:nitrogen-specific signal transduction histidine kinase
MDELRLIQVWIVATLGGVVGLGFLYVRRVEAGPAARLWAWAWLSFFVSLIVTASPSWAAITLAHATGTAFPALLLAGALAFAGHSVPGWLVPLGLAIGAVRGVCEIAGLTAITDLGVVLVEAPLDLAAALVLLRAARSHQRMPVVAALSVLHACFAVLEITNVHYLGDAEKAPFAYFALGGLATLVLALTQMLALLERARLSRAHDLELLRDIAQSGTISQSSADVVRCALEALRRRLDLDGGAGWMLHPSTNSLECLHYFGTPDEMPPDLSAHTANRPLPQQVLRSNAPIYIDDVLADASLPIHPWYGEKGFRSGALLPLSQAGESLGILVVGRNRVRPFDATEQRVLAVASDELSLALEHVGTVQRLAAERRVLASVVEASPTGILITGREHRIEILNAAFTKHMGEGDPDPWIGKRIDTVASEIAVRFEDPEEFSQAFLNLHRETPAFTTPVTLTDPEERELLIFTAPILSDAEHILGRVWVTRDISEERRLQEQLRQSQKMETLGTLAGGVAHDFNNQLTTILGNTRLLMGSFADDDDMRGSLTDIEHAANHCADLTRSLLAFARRAPLSMTSLRPESVVEQVNALLRSLLPSTIHFAVVNPAELPAVRADSTQLQQMLINLVVNARDAVRSDGHIQLEVSERDVAIAHAEDARPGRYVEFSVTDDGTGMDARTRGRVFDPFFTTKPVSEGTGLGLAMVYGAARAH